MRTLTIVTMLFFGHLALAQVGIGNTDPKATLDITASNVGSPSATDGILIPRVNTLNTTGPGANQNGMMVYLTADVTISSISYTKGFYYWDSGWFPIKTGNTLDQAYNQGGAGAGRTITADTGAVLIDGTDGILVTGTYGSGATLTRPEGSRMFFYPKKTAFRAGYYPDSYSWAETNIGDFSTAFGYLTLAGGESSTAMGYITSASGTSSTSMGSGTRANSFAETAIGILNNLTTPNSTTTFNASDQLFSIGNGTNNTNRSNALTIYKSGLMNINDEYDMPLYDGSANQVMKTDGAGVVSFVDATSLIADEIDWYEENTTTKPNAITDDIYTQGHVAIGKNTADYTLDILDNVASSTRGVYINKADNTTAESSSLYIQKTSAGTGRSHAIYTDVSGTGPGKKYGLFNNITSSANGNQYGVRNFINGSTSGYIFGTFNNLDNAGTGNQYGVYNGMRGSAAANLYGVYNEFNSVSIADETIGVRNRFSVGTPGATGMMGIYTDFVNPENGLYYGNRTEYSAAATGSGTKYGIYNLINSSAGGTHYGVYSDVQKATGYAGYFLGRVSIGTTTANNYILPASRGTNGQVMTIDGAGNLTFSNLTGESSTASNGLSETGNDIRLGGTLTQATTITQGNNNMVFNLNGTGDFNIQDAATNKLTVLDNGDTVLGGDLYWRSGNTGTGADILARLTNDNDDGRFQIYENDLVSITLDANGTSIFNEQGFDRDFRIETDNDIDMFFVDGSANRVGIGTTTPDYRLSVDGQLNLREGAGPGSALRVNGDEALWYNGTYFSWGFGGSHNYFADDVGIGINAPNYKLDVRDSSGLNYVAQIYNTSTGTDADGLRIQLASATPGANNTFVGFLNSTGSLKGRVVGSATGVNYLTTSDRRLKTNITNIDNALQLIDKIQPRRYEYKANLGTEEYGFIAQELQPFYPQAVSGTSDSDVETNPMMVDYSRLTPLLTAGMKELKAEVDQLKSENQKLKAQLSKYEQLEARLSALEKTNQKTKH